MKAQIERATYVRAIGGADGLRTLAIAAWAVLPISACLLEAVFRLGFKAIATLRTGLSPLEWAALALVVCLFWYVEGYRGLQRRFVPHVVSRAMLVASARAGWLRSLGAPLFVLSLVGSDRRSLVRAWCGVALIVLAIVVVRALPSHARGMIDAGVAVALAWGLANLLARFFMAVTKRAR